jgi:flagellar biogenesis protein FliO
MGTHAVPLLLLLLAMVVVLLWLLRKVGRVQHAVLFLVPLMCVPL